MCDRRKGGSGRSCALFQRLEHGHWATRNQRLLRFQALCKKRLHTVQLYCPDTYLHALSPSSGSQASGAKQQGNNRDAAELTSRFEALRVASGSCQMAIFCGTTVAGSSLVCLCVCATDQAAYRQVIVFGGVLFETCIVADTRSCERASSKAAILQRGGYQVNGGQQ